MILVAPVDFYASYNIALGANVNLLNELKAPAGFLLVAGGLMIGAIFVTPMITIATLLAAMIYLSYATSRFASMWFDGVPAEGLVQAAALETVIGLACLAVLLMRRIPARQVA